MENEKFPAPAPPALRVRPSAYLYAPAYYLSWLWFAFGGLLLNFSCLPLLLLPRPRRPHARVRSAIRWLFAFWLKWFHATGVFRITWKNFGNATFRPGTIYIANHPAIIDAPVLLSRLPAETRCIFKPALTRNPAVGTAALCADYSSGDAGIDLIREVSEKISGGASLLIFPEGTRTTPGTTLNPLRPGFALIAARAQAPIRLIHIRTSPYITWRGRAWWKLPPLPATTEVTLGAEIPPDADRTTQETTALATFLLSSPPPDLAP